MANTRAYLLSWNPERFPWDDIRDQIDAIDEAGSVVLTWSCGVTRSIQPGDRVFLIRLGREPRGIVGSGWAVSGVYEGEHWDPERARLGRSSFAASICGRWHSGRSCVLSSVVV